MQNCFCVVLADDGGRNHNKSGTENRGLSKEEKKAHKRAREKSGDHASRFRWIYVLVKAFQYFGEQCNHEHTSSGHEMLAEREHFFNDLRLVCRSIKDKRVKKAIKGRIALLNYNYDVYMATVMQAERSAAASNWR